MADEQLREHERRSKATGAPTDETAWLRERVRVGALDVGRVELAAALGHEPAVNALDPAPRSGWASFGRALLAPPSPPNEHAFLRAVTEKGRTIEVRSHLAMTTGDPSGRDRSREIRFVCGAGFVIGPETTGKTSSGDPLTEPNPGPTKILEYGDRFLVGVELFQVSRLGELTAHEWWAPSREAQPLPPPGHDLPLDAVRAASWLSELRNRDAELMAQVSVAFQIAVVRASGATDADAVLAGLAGHLERGTLTHRVHMDLLLGAMSPSTGVCFILSDEQEDQLRRDQADWDRANPGSALLSRLQYEMQDIDRGSFALERALPLLRAVGLTGLRTAVLPWLLA